MTGWLLTGGKFDNAAKRLLDNIDLGEHRFLLVDCGEVAYTIDHALPARIWIAGEETPPPDFFVIADSEGGFVLPFARHLERLGVFNYNSVDAKQIAMSKIATYQVLAKEGLPIVKTLVFHKSMTKEALLSEIGLPMILKPDDGFGGAGVTLVQTEAELAAALDEIKHSDALMLVQEYVATSKGRDVRVLTVGGEAVFAAQRKASDPGEFRSNLKVGGKAEEYPLTEEMKTLCGQVAKAVGLNLAGIDLLFGENGFVVGEVNSSAGFDSWLGKKDLLPVFLRDVGKNLMRRPLPHWRWLRLAEAAGRTQLAQLLLGLDDLAFYKAVHASFDHCAETQRMVLLEMLRAAKDTEFGEAHNFADMRTIEDYRKNVPLSEWDDYAAGIARLEKGEGDILFPGRAEFFYRTSGTTSGYKYVPEGAREALARKAISRARNAENFVLFSKDVATKVFAFTNKPSIDTTEAGIPRGTASGRTSETVDGHLKEALAYPPELVNEFEGDALVYMMLRCALMHPQMSAVLGNNALMLKKIIEYGQSHAEELIADIKNGGCRYPVSDALAKQLSGVLQANEARAAQLETLRRENRFIPKYYWPELRVAGFWLGGSVGVYVREVTPFLPETTRFMDVGYGASEAKMNVPTTPGTPAGALSVFSGFFEFLPPDGGAPLLAHELRDGETYEIVITTYGGLYRYRLKDLVRVEGFSGNTPNIYFVTKLADVANLAQEKIPGSQLGSALREAAAEHGHTCLHAQVYPDAESKRYVICLELADGPPDVAQLEEKLEKSLCEKVAQYNIYRGKMLAPLKLLLMKRGWGDSLVARYSQGNATAAQVKVPVVIDTLPGEEWQKQKEETRI